MLKKIIKETWMDFLGIFIIVGVGVLIASIISWYFLFVPLFMGIVMGSVPYIKIISIMDNKLLGS